MASGPTVTAADREPEDPLAHLPCSRILEFRKGHVIYSPESPSAALYLMIDGKVKVQRIIGKKVVLLVDIYRMDDLFGESAFTNSAESHEMATAMEKTRIMTWMRSEVEELMSRRPRLSISLIQLLARRCHRWSERIESCASENLERRLARTLIQFANRFGRAADDGSTQIMPLAHELIAQYLGTSREIVTHQLIQFRRKGYVRYSRKEIVVYPGALRQLLKGHPHVASAGGATSP